MSFPYRLSDPVGHRATFGLVALQSDETIEHELLQILRGDGVAFYVSRVPSSAEVTPDTLAAMEADLPQAASLLPPTVSYDVVGYGCTSGATVIGPDRVAELVQGATNAGAATDPLTATRAAMAELGVQKIGLVTPYIEDVTRPLQSALEDVGISVATCVSFDEAEEAKVARIDPTSALEAALSVGWDVDAVFLSCTNLRALEIVERAEAALNIPVFSSNVALAWHMAKLAGIPPGVATGRLLQTL